MGKTNCCDSPCGRCCIYACGIVGAILVILGGMLVFIFDTAYVAIVENNLVIADNTAAFDSWKAPPPYYLEFYLFNCTNPEEFLAGAANKNFVKPRFDELGPYVYRTELLKDQTEFIDNPDDFEELKFRSTGKYYFEPERSRGKENDPVTTLNLIAAGAPSIVEYAIELGGDAISVAQRGALRRGLNLLINDAGSQLLFQKTAAELFFGFTDDLLSAIVNTIELVPGVPDDLPNEFGLFQTMNVSAGWYQYKIYTGKEDYRLMNRVTEYEGMRELDYWFGKECNMINGTDGTTVEGFMNKEDRIYFFVDDICRSMYATFYREVDIKGLPGWEYRVPAELFEAPVLNKENECFCPDLSLDICKYSGGLPLATCQSGAPVFMTSPHFLYAPHYLQFVEGLNPNEEEHSTPLVYEPSTGICLKADKRLQISLYLQPSRHYDILDGTFETPYAFPVMWLNESYVTSDEDAEAAYALLVVPAEVFAILQILFCIIGGVMMLGSILFILARIYNKSVKVETDSVDSYKKSRYHKAEDVSGQAFENSAMGMKETEPDETYAVIDKDSRSASLSDEDSAPVTAL